MLDSLRGVNWIKTYPIDSLQIYFAASLEIQEELINNGFNVPRSPDGKVKMPVPLIYSNFRGWLKPTEPITIERLIPPDWLGLKAGDLGWKKTFRGGKEAYRLPEEEVYVNIGISGNSIVFDLDIRGYHLERTSIRGVNPDKWTNWAMFYISLDYIEELVNILEGYLSKNTQLSTTRPRKEVQQRGKEVTYYVEVPVKDFSFCLGCFDLAQKYLYMKAKEHCKINRSSDICRNPDKVISKLKLRLKHSRSVNTFAKVGIAKISGKRPQIMIKIASTQPKKVIHGILKPKIEGKARGELIHCDHKEKKQYVILDLTGFYKALSATKKYINKLPKEE